MRTGRLPGSIQSLPRGSFNLGSTPVFVGDVSKQSPRNKDLGNPDILLSRSEFQVVILCSK